MKKTVLALTLLAFSTPAFAQLGGLGGAVRRAQQVQDTKKKIDDLTFTDEEEQTIGADVSTLGEDAAAKTRKNRDQRTTKTKTDQRFDHFGQRRTVRPDRLSPPCAKGNSCRARMVKPPTVIAIRSPQLLQGA